MKKISFVLVALVCFTSAALGQDAKPDKSKKTAAATEVISELPRGIINFRPNITLQEALKKAEEHIAKYDIDVSNYYLSSITSFMYGSVNQKKIHVWQVSWNNDRGVLGDYITILVSIDDGAVWQIPSM